VFAVVPKLPALVYLIQEKCLQVKEKALPEKAAKVAKYLLGEME